MRHLALVRRMWYVLDNVHLEHEKGTLSNQQLEEQPVQFDTYKN